MDHFGEQPKFEIQPIIEQKPFKNPAVQSFFAEWCKINDSIQPQMIDRDKWEQRGIKGVLEKRPDGKQTLFIPEDLQLWEMVGVMEIVDYDTFARKPEQQTEAKEKLLVLAKTFQNSGTYIAQRLETINEGQEIAKALALEFYEYGQSLVEGERSETTPDLDEIATHHLTPADTETVDRFLAGDNLYESRQKRVEKAIAENPSRKDELYETERRRTLSEFFRVAEKAFALKSKDANGELRGNTIQLKPWQNHAPIHSVFLAKIEKAMTQKIETPRREFEMAIFRRGLEKLTGEMKERGWKHAVNSFFENIGLDLRVEQKKLVDVLRIPELKAELEAIRQTGDLTKISQKEREITDRIQSAVSSFPYDHDTEHGHRPSEILTNQYIDCVGASILGGALMKEAGLTYLVGDVPEHSILFLVTSDSQVEWRDMLSASFNDKLTDEMIEGVQKDGTPVTVKSIVTFAQKPTLEGLMFDIKSHKYREKLRWVKEGQRQYVTVFEQEYGQQMQILNTTGNFLQTQAQHEKTTDNSLHSRALCEEAVEAYLQATAFSPKSPYPYNGLGNALLFLGRNEEAVKAYRQAVTVNPKDPPPYNGLGNALLFLGRNEEAIEAYQEFINLADEKQHAYFITRAEQIIAELTIIIKAERQLRSHEIRRRRGRGRGRGGH